MDVLLRWTVPPEADVAGYRLYTGSAPRAYQTQRDLGLLPGTTLDGIAAFVLTDAPVSPIYVAVTAVNTAGLESDYSNEKPIPAFVGGLPRADAGPDQSGVLGQGIAIGVAPEPGVFYLWWQSAGPAGLLIADRSASQTTVRAAVPGTYELELIAADAAGFARRDQVIVTIRASLTPPASTPAVTATATRPAPPTSTPSPTTTAAGSAVFGDLAYYTSGAPIPGAYVDIVDATTPGEPPVASARTDSAGRFAVSGLPRGVWTVRPHADLSGGGAVSALDAAYVLQAMHGARELTPEQRLACEASGNGTLTSSDASLILQTAIGLRATVPAADWCGTEWLFDPVPNALALSVRAATLGSAGCEPGAFTIDTAATPLGPFRFRGVLLGDCTGSWAASASGGSAAPVPAAVDMAVHRIDRRSGLLTLHMSSSVPVYAVEAELATPSRLLRLFGRRGRGGVVAVVGAVGADRYRVALASSLPLSDNGSTDIDVLFESEDQDVAFALDALRVNEDPPGSGR